jgi:hypothetical protein
MTRRLLFMALGAGLAFAVPAHADDLPRRKPGLWEMKVLKIGSSLPELTMQHCTDATTDKDMANSVSPIAKQICSRQDVKKTATGYVTDAVCSVAGTGMTSHSEITGDFNSAYSMVTRTLMDKGPEALRDTTTKIQAKWLGDCRPGQKPGDILMPGGFKLNVKDAEKFKNLVPSQTK